MRKLYIVKTSKQFEDIINNGKNYKNKYFVVHEKENNLMYDRFGISVFRNKYNRIIRSILDNYKKLYINNKDYIIILRKEAINVNFDILQDSLFTLINNNKKG